MIHFGHQNGVDECDSSKKVVMKEVVMMQINFLALSASETLKHLLLPCYVLVQFSKMTATFYLKQLEKNILLKYIYWTFY